MSHRRIDLGRHLARGCIGEARCEVSQQTLEGKAIDECERGIGAPL
jgi:hypothetical protein